MNCDRPTPVPLSKLPMTREPLPPDPGPADYARAWANTCATYESLIKTAQHGAALSTWWRLAIAADLVFTLLLVALGLCQHFGACR